VSETFPGALPNWTPQLLERGDIKVAQGGGMGQEPSKQRGQEWKDSN